MNNSAKIKNSNLWDDKLDKLNKKPPTKFLEKKPDKRQICYGLHLTEEEKANIKLSAKLKDSSVARLLRIRVKDLIDGTFIKKYQQQKAKLIEDNEIDSSNIETLEKEIN